MRLRTVTGNRYETPCQCGCSGLVPRSDTVKVVIDLDLPSGKRTYLFAHSPDAGKWKGNVGNGSSAPPTPPNGGNGHATGFAPESALPAPAPKAPNPPAQPYGPAPTPLALLGSAGVAEPSPSAQANTAWATSQLTFSSAAYESCKAGYADYARPGETPEALRARVHAVVLQDVEWQARALRDLHVRLSDPSGGVCRVLPKDGPCPPPFGDNGRAVAASPATSSPAPRAGAPSGSTSPPRMIVPSASPTAEGAVARPSPQGVPVGSGAAKPPVQTRASEERPLRDLVREVRLDLSDADPLRLSRKMKVWCDWLGKRGYTSANDVRSGDEWALEGILSDFEHVNRGGRP